MRNKDHNFEAMLSVAVANDMYRELDEFDAIDAGDIDFTPSFERKMLKILHKGKYINSTKKIRSLLKRSLIACLIIISAVFTIGMTQKPVREAFLEMVLSWYDEYISISNHFNDDMLSPPETIEEKREPTVGVENYTKIINSDSPVMYIVEYMENDHYMLIYTQKILTASDNSVDNVNCTIFETQINGHKALFFEYNDKRRNNILIWSDTEYSYEISGLFEKNDLINIALGIK